ncbi:MAG: iron-sulfur cluster repair di-iron protein [Breznakibacter sp.]
MDTLQYANPNIIGRIVAADFRKAEVFKRAGIDFCCGGNKTVQQACDEKGIDAGWLLAQLVKVDGEPLLPSLDYRSWGLSFLCDYIVNTHHRYVLDTLPDLLGYTAKIAVVHGQHHPELPEVAHLFAAVDKELRQHLAKEESVLFPAIKALEEGDKAVAVIIGTEIARINEEHEFAGSTLNQINHLTGGYQVPDDACNTYRVALQLLKQFEDDLHLHVHLENNILFPAAVAKAQSGQILRSEVS